MLDEGADADERFDSFANDEICPVLDPKTGLCELYDSRPMTCRTFGPPVRSEDGVGVCELCFHGATDEQIAGCEMVADPDDLEASLLKMASWRPDDWGLLDALNHMLTLRASSRGHRLRNDSPAIQDAAFRAKLDKELTFYYEAEYPGKELVDE